MNKNEQRKKINRSQKEKHRHKLQKEITRKPSFKVILAKNVSIAVAVTILVCVIGLLFAGKLYTENCKSLMYGIINAGQYYIEGLHDTLYGDTYDEDGNVYEFSKNEELTDETINTMNCMLDELSVDLDCYMALYDNRDNTLIADASEDIYMVNLIEAVGSSYGFCYGAYVLDEDQIEKSYPGLIDEILSKVKNLNESSAGVYYCSSDGKGHYFKGGYVVPETITIYCSANSITGWSMEDEVVATYDLSKVDTTGYRYEYSPLEELLFRTYYLKNGYGSGHIQYQYYNDNIQNVYDVREQQEITVFGMNSIHSENILFGEKEMTLVVSGTYNMLYDYQNEITMGCCLVLFCLLLVSIIISYIIYLRKRERYEIELYRRNTTNAMAHDLKSPLMAISAYAENLASGSNPEKNQYYGETILDTVKDMDQMIANLLNLSQIENGSLRLDKEQTNIASLLEECLPKYEVISKERGLQVVVNGECRVQCDRMWMLQLIDNLLSNAIKYAKENSKVAISMEENRFVVKNYFEGKLDKTPEELTESFVKGDNSRSDNRGTGVGLAIVKSVAQIHGFGFKVQIKEDTFISEVIFN